MLYLTRKVRFCAAHRYSNPAWSDEENRRIFGKCFNVHGHGHNYELEITVAGEIDPETGMVLNLKDLDHLIKDAVTEHLDHKFLNKDVAYFAEVLPTTENIAVWIWEQVSGKLKGCTLARVRLYEDPDLFVEYYGGNAPFEVPGTL